jgi:hypothetical protein
MERRNDSGSDNMVFSIFYGINLLACREAKPGRVIPRRGIIGTTQRYMGIFAQPLESVH